MNVKDSETVRSFLAIELDEDLVPKILDVQKEFKKTNANIKYVPSQNMHFTLKFFGYGGRHQRCCSKGHKGLFLFRFEH